MGSRMGESESVHLLLQRQVHWQDSYPAGLTFAVETANERTIPFTTKSRT